jgi:hypothetical protein
MCSSVSSHNPRLRKPEETTRELLPSVTSINVSLLQHVRSWRSCVFLERFTGGWAGGTQGFNAEAAH